MAAILMPKRDDPTRTGGKEGGGKTGAGIGAALGAVVGGVGGFAAGGPAGAVIGAGKGALAGAGAGSFIGGVVQPGHQGRVVGGGQAPAGIQSPQSGVDRRLAEVEEDPLFALNQAQAALKRAPLATQDKFLPVIEQALSSARQQRAAGVV